MNEVAQQNKISTIENNQFLTFVLGAQTYGLEFNRVREILTYRGVTHIPDSKPWVKGVIDLRGEAVPLIDLRIRFSTSEHPDYHDKTVVIAAKVGDGKIIAYIVDNVDSVETIKYDELMPANNQGVIDAKFLKGYFKGTRDRMVVVVDAEKILNDDDMQRLLGGGAQ